MGGGGLSDEFESDDGPPVVSGTMHWESLKTLPLNSHCYIEALC